MMFMYDVRTNSIIAASILGTIFFSFAIIVATAISYVMTRRLIETIVQGGDPLAENSLFASLLFAGLACVASVLVSISPGFLYAYFHRKETEPPQVDAVLIGGFSSGIIVGFLGAVIYAFIQVFVLLPLQQEVLSVMVTSEPEMWLRTSMMGFKAGFSLLFNGILTVAVFGITGAIGGVFGRSFLAQPPKPEKTVVS